MKNNIIIGLICWLASSAAFSQKGITIEVESLELAKDTLPESIYPEIINKLVLENYNLRPGIVEPETEIDKSITGKIPCQIIAHSKYAGSLVNFSYNSFFYGMYQAYADHRPFVISPDMIWLLICQGFSSHVNNNAEKLRKYFVDFDGKMSLVVRNDQVALNDPDAPWETVFEGLKHHIDQNTNNELVKVLSADFSTTTSVERAAVDITIMESMKPFFEYIVVYVACGIPEITLKGTTEDWQKILNKARALRPYELDWWIDELEPVLEEFVDASQGDISKRFWRNMFKTHSAEEYGAPDIIDGWIVKFFPYDKLGNRMDLEYIENHMNLPREIVSVDILYKEIYSAEKSRTFPLEINAGFIGLKQNKATMSLEPEIGWYIRKKDTTNTFAPFLNHLTTTKNEGLSFGPEFAIRVKKIPEDLLGLSDISELYIEFIDSIDIPDEMGKIKIKYFKMYGKISESEIKRICSIFPDTFLVINSKAYNENIMQK